MNQLLQIDILKHTSILNNVGDIVLCRRDWTTEPEVHLLYIVLYLLCHLTFNRHAKLQYCMQLSCSTLCTTCIYLRSKDDNRYVRTNSFLTKINANWWQLNHIWRCPDNINAVKCYLWILRNNHFPNQLFKMILEHSIDLNRKKICDVWPSPWDHHRYCPS